MNAKDRFLNFIERFPHPHEPFYARPHLTRRELLGLAGAGVTVSCLAGRAKAGPVIDSTPVELQRKARNVIFVLMAGAPSHIDTFDFKNVEGITPADFNATRYGDILWPQGILPKLGERLGDMAIVRSMMAWAAAHQISQHWVQIGRNPTGALGDIAPNMGSVVAIEKESERRASDVLPTFLALNSAGAIGSGYFPAAFDPMKVQPSANGLGNTTNADGAARTQARMSFVKTLDGALRGNSSLGTRVDDYADFASAAEALTYNAQVQRAFSYTADESARYGNTNFGNACLLAQKVLAADLGTRFVQITIGGWDMHQNIYSTQAGGLYLKAREFDSGVAAMLDDLKKAGIFEETLVVMLGEFGRTVGRLSATAGRDHYLQQFVAFAGGGVKGGRALGVTDAAGSATIEYGWSRNREVRPEDVEATIYSALGINWTTIRYDDPFARGFEYVPYAKEDLYGPINELWKG
jgi:hypothetical protein